MWARIGRLLNTAESRLALYQALSGGGGVAGMTGLYAYAVHATGWLNSYGVIAWVVVMSIGALVGLGIVCLIFAARGLAARSNAIRHQALIPMSVNPLETRFEKQRVRLLDFSNPITPVITGKEFIDCEIVGPGVFLLWHNTTITDSRFNNCDCLKITTSATSFSGLAFQNSLFLRCTFHQMMVVAFPGAWEIMEAMHGSGIWFNQGSTHGPASPSSTAPGTRPRTRPG